MRWRTAIGLEVLADRREPYYGGGTTTAVELLRPEQLLLRSKYYGGVVVLSPLPEPQNIKGIFDTFHGL